jgi:hypothetical protein
LTTVELTGVVAPKGIDALVEVYGVVALGLGLGTEAAHDVLAEPVFVQVIVPGVPTATDVPVVPLEAVPAVTTAAAVELLVETLPVTVTTSEVVTPFTTMTVSVYGVEVVVVVVTEEESTRVQGVVKVVTSVPVLVPV